MIKAFLLVLAPGSTWARISLAQRSIAWVFILYWLPWMVCSTLAEAYSMQHWGDSLGEFNHITIVPMELLKRYALTQFIGGTAILLVGSWIIHGIAVGMHQRFEFRQTFTLVAYAMGPLLLGRWLDCFPAINTWVCWGIGAVLMVHVLYQGVGEVMRPEMTNGFALYLVCSSSLFLLSALVHVVAVVTLHGGHGL